MALCTIKNTVDLLTHCNVCCCCIYTQKMVVLTDALSPNDHCERLISVSKALREIAEAAHLLKE
ncbi:hypothetical protein Plhal304r1_c059g0147251 [Plasmopara halstedii]